MEHSDIREPMRAPDCATRNPGEACCTRTVRRVRRVRWCRSCACSLIPRFAAAHLGGVPHNAGRSRERHGSALPMRAAVSAIQAR